MKAIKASIIAAVLAMSASGLAGDEHGTSQQEQIDAEALATFHLSNTEYDRVPSAEGDSFAERVQAKRQEYRKLDRAWRGGDR